MSHHTRYLIIGSSHAALEAVAALRMHDADGSLTMATRDTHLPYSPTLLPYVVSGRSSPDKAFLRDAGFFTTHKVDYRPGKALVRLDLANNAAVFSDGTEMHYEKLLLATGATPAIPPIPGVTDVDYHVLRTLDDALKLKAALGGARRAVVLGGGLVGMHAAENLVEAGAQVTVVEMQPQVLGGYFDSHAAGFIERAFAARGAKLMTGRRVVGVAPAGGGASVELDDGTRLDADLLLVATGVRPQLDYLGGSDIAHEHGIVVDDAMRTSRANVWAAGDCAQARDFYTGAPAMNAILPDAAEQGRIAGMAMAGDPGLKPYAGGVPLNTYRFFGRHAVAVGTSRVSEGGEEHVRMDEAGGRYLRVILKDGRLQGIFGIGEFFDGGVMWQLIRRRVELGAEAQRLVDEPLAAGRRLMSREWR